MMIEIKNLKKSFGDLIVFESLNLNIKKDSINILMSNSGKGKTTLINILLGFLESDCGEILNLPLEISVVFQEDRLIENISALKNLELSNISKDDALDILKIFGISYKLKVNTLSGGMKRRVSLARALKKHAEFYIFDEPFKGLDDSNKNIVIEEIKKLSKTVLIITHDTDDLKLFGLENSSESQEFFLYN